MPETATIALPSVAEKRSVAAEPARVHRDWKTPLVACGLAAATFAAYLPMLRNGFVSYDDPDFIVANPVVRHGLSWANIAWAFRTTSEDYWHPLTWISHMADVQIFGMNPAGHHLVSLLLHVANVVLLFALLRKATGSVGRSGFVAGLFAMLPLNVEAVAWASERKTVLCMTFTLLALWAYGWYARKPGAVRYAAVAIAFLCALMAKPMAMTLPILFLLTDYWPLGRMRPDGENSFVKLCAEKIPLFALCIADGVLTVYAQRENGALAVGALLPWHVRAENAAIAYVGYIAKGLWPARLAMFYPHPENSLSTWKVGASALVLLSVTAAVWKFREKRYLVAGWLWYLVAMFPVIGIVQVGRQAMADRYAYLPFVGLFAMIVWLLGDFAARSRPLRTALISAGVGIVISYGFVAHAQAGYWHDNYTLYTHALQVTDRNAVAENDLGAALVDDGRRDLAEMHFRAATEDDPGYATAHFNLGAVMQTEGRGDEAMLEYAAALNDSRDSAERGKIFNNLAALRALHGDLSGALAAYNAALAENPNQPTSCFGRGLIEFGQGQMDAALADFTAAMNMSPTADFSYWRGRALEAKGDLAGAADAYDLAMRFVARVADAQARLAAIRARLAAR